MPVSPEEEFLGTERFAIERRLGAGAFGVVYRAFDRERGAAVALKTLRHADVEALYRLKNEFRSLQGIAHPNLVALYELLEDAGRWFFTMELVEGANFLDHIWGVTTGESAPTPSPEAAAATTRSQEAGSPGSSACDAVAPARSGPSPRHVPLNADRLRVALRQFIEGLRALHAAGKLHRDIKPSNVLVSPEGRVVLLDFGLVTELGGLRPERSLSLVGTPTYMSPEQGTGRPVTEASDWYSLGVMLFQVLTGQRPFEGDFVEMMWEKQHREAAAPGDLALGVPDDLDRLCRDLLRPDPAERPTGEQILQRLGGAKPRRSTAAAAAPSRPAPFVGREAHLAALRVAYDATRGGHAAVVYVRGGSGMGKTALVRRFLDSLRPEDAVKLSGRCYERESVPYKAFDSLVDALSQHLKKMPSAQAEALLPRDILALAKLFPVLRRVEAIAGARRRVLEIPDSQELRRRAFGALRELFGRMSDQKPLVLFIDDLGWGDVDSAALLGELLRQPDPPPLLLIAAFRSEDAETSPLLKALAPGRAVESGEARGIVVGELNPEEARELARELLADTRPTASNAESIARESGGNPLFIDELVRYVRTNADAPHGARAVEGEASDATIARVIQSRLRLLPEESHRLLEIAAVAGKPVSLMVARQAADLPSAEEAAAALRHGHLVRTRGSERGDEIEPYHDRIREAVIANLSADRLRFLHRRLALALESSEAPDPEALALHFQEAGEDERAGAYAEAAARRASEALAFNRAARLYRLALDLGVGQERTVRRDLSVQLGDALANAGRGSEAAAAYLTASEGTTSADALELRRRAAEQLLRSGHLDEGLRLLETVLNRIGMKLADNTWAALLSFLLRRAQIRLRGLAFQERDASQIAPDQLIRVDTCWSVSTGLSIVDTIQGKDFQARHLLLALRAGEPYRVARALANEGAYYATAGWANRRRTAEIFELAREVSARVENPHAIAMVDMAAGIAAYLEGRWKVCWELAERGLSILRERCTGVSWELDTTHIVSFRALYYRGEVRELSLRLPTLLAEARERDDLFAETSLNARHSQVALLAADQPERAAATVSQAIGLWSHRGFLMQHYFALISEGEIALYRGEPARAWEILNDRWRGLKRSRLLRLQVFRIESWNLRARAAQAAALDDLAGMPGKRAELLRSAERDSRLIRREKVPWGDALATALDAGIAMAYGRVDAAERLLAEARGAFEQADMALHAAVARRRHGELLGGDSGREEVGAADAWMAGQLIRNPDRFAAVLAPGRWAGL